MSTLALHKALRLCLTGALAATLFGCATSDQFGEDWCHDHAGACTGDDSGDTGSSTGSGKTGNPGVGHGESSGSGVIVAGESSGSGGAGGAPAGGCQSWKTLPATRTQGFWKNHACVIEGAATGSALVPVTLGAATQLGTADAAIAYFDTAPNGDSKLILGHQLLAAKLNASAFSIGAQPFHDWDGDGTKESVAELLAIADALFDGGSDDLRARMSSVLDALNQSGDALDLWFDPLCQKPAERCDGIDNNGDGRIDEACVCADPMFM